MAIAMLAIVMVPALRRPAVADVVLNSVLRHRFLSGKTRQEVNAKSYQLTAPKFNFATTSNALGKSRPTSKADMIGTVRRHLHRRQEAPRVIRNLFKETHVRYAA
ncbi:exported protein of unknown function [Burkholderia multivorans]